jgi:hypothetical protein
MLHSRPVVLAALLAAVIVSCGSANQGSAACTPSPTLPSLPPAISSAGSVSVVADHDRVAPGASVSFTVTVAGPLHFTAACAGPVQLIVSDQAGLHVFAESPPAPHGEPCDAVSLDAGQKARYTLSWQTDSSLPPGGYLATLTAGDQPAVSAQVTVGGQQSGATPAC